jgi:hypothetical protein
VGRRSRNRAAGRPADRQPTPRPAPLSDERPKAPWHPFPLVELCVLVGLILIVLGFLDIDSDRGRLLLVFGMVLASLGGLDTALREHFNGFRSHSTLLAGLPAVLAAGALFFARTPWIVVVAAFVLVFAGAFLLFRRAFRRRSGGLSLR